MLAKKNLGLRLVSALPVLARFASTFTRDRARAEDLVQDTIVRALTHADKFDGSHLNSWLYVIMRNTYLADLRRARLWVEDPDGATAEAVPAPGDPLSALLVREDLARVARLPPLMRGALVLVAAGASYDEAGVEAAAPAGTIKSRVHRARVLLGAV